MKQVRNLPRYATRLEVDNGRSVFVTPHIDLIGDIAYFEQMRRCLEVRHEGADAGHALDVTLVSQFTQCTICRHA